MMKVNLITKHHSVHLGHLGQRSSRKRGWRRS
jgi:hypothetical protein